MIVRRPFALLGHGAPLREGRPGEHKMRSLFFNPEQQDIYTLCNNHRWTDSLEIEATSLLASDFEDVIVSTPRGCYLCRFI